MALVRKRARDGCRADALGTNSINSPSDASPGEPVSRIIGRRKEFWGLEFRAQRPPRSTRDPRPRCWSSRSDRRCLSWHAEPHGLSTSAPARAPSRSSIASTCLPKPRPDIATDISEEAHGCGAPAMPNGTGVADAAADVRQGAMVAGRAAYRTVRRYRLQSALHRHRQPSARARARKCGFSTPRPRSMAAGMGSRPIGPSRRRRRAGCGPKASFAARNRL